MRDGWTGDQLGSALQADRAAGDGAMFAVWLHGDWRYLTSKMTDAEREAAADAVARHLARTAPDGTVDGLRWWQ